MAKRKCSLSDIIFKEHKKKYDETMRTLMRNRTWIDSYQAVVDVIKDLIEVKSIVPVITDAHRPVVTLQVDLPDGYSYADCKRVLESMSDMLPKGRPEYHEYVKAEDITDYHLLTSYMQEDRQTATFDIKFWGWIK